MCEVITDKLVAKIPAAYGGKIVKLNCKADEICQVGQALLDMEVGDDVNVKEDSHKEEPAPAAEPTPEKPAAAPETKKEQPAAPVIDEAAEAKVYTTHAVRLLAKRLKISLAQIKGTGKRGRVTKDDVFAFVETGGQPAQKTKKVAKKVEAPVAGKGDKLIKLTGIRRAMVKSMTDALEIPHETVQEELVMDNLDRVKNEYLAVNPKAKLTYLPFFMKAMSCALVEFPIINSLTTGPRDQNGLLVDYVEKAEHNISIAVDSPSGLLVPNIKSVQNKTILQLNEEVRQLISRARKSTVTQQDLSDGTITLSSIGGIGGIIGTPVIFRPQTALIAVGRTRQLPVFRTVKGIRKVFPSNVCTMCLAADRRVIEPVTITKFVVTFKKLIEDMDLLLLHLK